MERRCVIIHPIDEWSETVGVKELGIWALEQRLIGSQSLAGYRPDWHSFGMNVGPTSERTGALTDVVLLLTDVRYTVVDVQRLEGDPYMLLWQVDERRCNLLGRDSDAVRSRDQWVSDIHATTESSDA